MSKRVGVTLSTAACVALATAGVAIGKSFETTVTAGLDAGPEGDAIAGKVKSDKKACRKDRKVKVTYQDEPGPEQTLGTTRTDGHGNYSVAFPDGGFAAPGTYTAIAKKTEVGNATCKKGTGTYEHFGGP